MKKKIVIAIDENGVSKLTSEGLNAPELHCYLKLYSEVVWKDYIVKVGEGVAGKEVNKEMD